MNNNFALMIRLFTTCAFILTVHICIAQSFTAKASAGVIGKKDVVQVDYRAADVSIRNFQLPQFPNWVLISGPTISSSTVAVNNVVQQETIYSITLQPRGPGNHIIPGAFALIDNAPKRTNGLVVQVRNVDHVAGAAPRQSAPQKSLLDVLSLDDQVPTTQYLRKGENAIEKIRNNIIVRLEVNKKSVFVGEPIVATYKLCTRLRSKSRVVKQPSFTGSTVVELTEDNQTSHVENINGTSYNVFVIRKVELIPLDAGPLVLPEAQVENTVSFYDASKLDYRDMFYGSPNTTVQQQVVTMQNKPSTVDVIPLPASPATLAAAPFTGAVGSFSLNISAGEQAKTNGNNSILFSIQGIGNLQGVKAPAVTWPQGLEGFDATEQLEYDKSGTPVRVAKTFTYPYVADKAGTYTIPAIPFTYFDPNTKQYVTKSTHSFVVQVAQSSKSVMVTSKSLSDLSFLQDPLYLVIGGGVLLLVVGLFWYRASRKAKPAIAPATVSNTEETQQPIPPQGSEYLTNIRDLEPNTDGAFFYRQLSKNLNNYIKVKYGIESAELPSYASQHPANAQPLEQLKVLIDRCNLAMYTPLFNIDEANMDRYKAMEILNKLEKAEDNRSYMP